MSKRLTPNYTRLAEIATRAKLYTGPTKRLTPAQKGQLTKLNKAFGSVFSPATHFVSVKVPEEYRQEYGRRGFKVYKDRVLVNSPGATRVSFSKRRAEIVTYGRTENVEKIRRFSLDLDLEHQMIVSDERDAMTSLSQGGSDGIFGRIDRAALNAYLATLSATQGTNYHLPAIVHTESVPLGKRVLSAPDRRVKHWDSTKYGVQDDSSIDIPNKKKIKKATKKRKTR